MRYQRRRLWAVIIGFVFFGLTSGALPGCHPRASITQSDAPSAERTLNFRLMEEAWSTIEKFYVDRSAIKPQLITYGAISGMIDVLGDTGHSRFLTPERVAQERNFERGNLEGIGAEVQMKNNQVVIVAPLDDSPAQRAGLKPGDIILKVNGEEVSGLPLDVAVGRILGPAGSPVTLTILDPRTGRTEDVSLVRARIVLRSVDWHRLPGTTVAHVRMMTFSKGAGENLRKALLEVRKEGLTGLVLDLRNNPGGLLNEAVTAASQFLESGNVVLEKNAIGKVAAIPVTPGGAAQSLPLVVLVNGGTSSAAEIVAGALQDARRARLVGEKTFGTGTVLRMFPLSDGSALLLAIEEWLTPAGHVIWHHGITPDLVIALPPEVSLLLPEKERAMTPEGLRQSGDVQLLRALELLTQRARFRHGEYGAERGFFYTEGRRVSAGMGATRLEER